MSDDFEFKSGDPLQYAASKKIRIVIFESPYDQIEDPFVQEFFGKMFALKVDGYRKVYPDGILPLDSSDFIANHILLCSETSNGELELIMGFKSTSYQKAIKHKLTFPLFEVIGKANLPLHKKCFEETVADLAQRNIPMAYNGGWTISPKIRSDKELVNFCKILVPFLLLNYYRTYRITHVFSAGSIRFNSNKLSGFVGFEYMYFNGERLPPFHSEPFFGELAEMHMLKEFNPMVIHWAQKFMPLWEARITVSPKKEADQKSAEKKAA